MYQTTLAIRIGINTGEVVAGVIGTHKFIYDLSGVTLVKYSKSYGIARCARKNSCNREHLSNGER